MFLYDSKPNAQVIQVTPEPLHSRPNSTTQSTAPGNGLTPAMMAAAQDAAAATWRDLITNYLNCGGAAAPPS